MIFAITLSVAFWMSGAGFVHYYIYRISPKDAQRFGVFLCSLAFWPIVPGVILAKRFTSEETTE